MIIIPAVDIRGAKAVRLEGGDFKKEKVYFDNPLMAAKLWESQGAGFLHIVDLEGAAQGRLKNFKSIKAICQGIGIPIEVGGGIRKEEDIQKLLGLGVKRVVLGTVATEDRVYLKKLLKRFKEKIIISIDAVDGKVASRGWKDKLKIDAISLIKELVKLGVEKINYTDIKRDGTLKGVRIDIAKEILKKTKVKIYFGGGITSIEDIIELKKLEAKGLLGVVIGKALYEGKIDLKDALRVALS